MMVRCLMFYAHCMHPLPTADEIKNYFEKFGPLTVDWPHKAQTKAYFPPKGEVFAYRELPVVMHLIHRLCIPTVL